MKKTKASFVSSTDEGDALKTALKDELSPEAVAAIAVLLDASELEDTDWPDEVCSQVGWFRGVLVEMLGGEKQLKRIRDIDLYGKE